MRINQWMQPTIDRLIVAFWISMVVVTVSACTAHNLPDDVNPGSELMPRPPKKPLSNNMGKDMVSAAAGIDADTRALVYAIMEGSDSKLVSGNHAELLIDGPQTFSAMIAAMEKAEHHIHLESYIFYDDQLGQRLQDVLVKKAESGVKVRVIYDAYGSFATAETFFEKMRKQGVEVLAYRPLNIENIAPWKINNRDHRKLLVIDGKTAFTGGINIMASYTSSSSSNPGETRGLEEGWRDTHVKIDGPAAHIFQRYFLDTWMRISGESVEEADAIFPKIEQSGHTLVGAVASRGDEEEANIYTTYMAAINNARKTIVLVNAYFVPNNAMIEALKTAAERGVSVTVMVPAFTDSSVTIAASQSSYERLLKSGVKIFERHGALLHAKTATIDGVVSIVGSANLDVRSFLHNNEITAVIVSNQFAAKAENAFQYDLRKSKQITLEEWQRRPFFDKLKEVFGGIFTYWL